jgi:2-keto-4-pentenoate hydratase/2-oxohepta-3-ene-1,7-dioic acid hydratase in catechol pathway
MDPGGGVWRLTTDDRQGDIPFVLGRFRGPDGAAFAAVVAGEDVIPLSGLLPGTTDIGDALADWPATFAALAGLIPGYPPGEVLPLDSLEILPPVVPRQVFQSGANYRTHVIDLVAARQGDTEEVRARAAAMMDERARNDQPYVFIGLPSALCGPDDDVILPDTGAGNDWELELTAVMGRPAYRVSRRDALSYVAGYTIVNDITARDRVFRPDLPGIGTDWLAAKNAPTFLPAGPWLVPAAFAGDPMKLRITLSLNGEVMQDESTADMIFDVARLIEHTSSITTMLPGDLLLTGSPAGNGASRGRLLRPGDVMEGTITGLGRQRNRCVTR